MTTMPTGKAPLPDVGDAVARLRAGELVAYPTEAVWGLGCDPFDEAVVTRLLALKERAVAQGLILVAADAIQFDGLADWGALEPARCDAVRATWPGPHTWIVPATPRVPRWITGQHDGVAIRVSAHPVVAAMCRGFGGVIVSTSANRSGRPPASRREDLDPVIVAGVDLVAAGEVGGLDRPTPIRVARTGLVLRD